jgi:hypothetical protein
VSHSKLRAHAPHARRVHIALAGLHHP